MRSSQRSQCRRPFGLVRVAGFPQQSQLAATFTTPIVFFRPMGRSYGASRPVLHGSQYSCAAASRHGGQHFSPRSAFLSPQRVHLVPATMSSAMGLSTILNLDPDLREQLVAQFDPAVFRAWPLAVQLRRLQPLFRAQEARDQARAAR